VNAAQPSTNEHNLVQEILIGLLQDAELSRVA
jgi:hypothetical protein